jgi:hypothetical protein
MSHENEGSSLQDLASAIAIAARPYLDPEVATAFGNQLACCEPGELDEGEIAASLRVHIKHFKTICGDAEACARSMVRAFNRFWAGPGLASTRPEEMEELRASATG